MPLDLGECVGSAGSAPEHTSEKFQHHGHENWGPDTALGNIWLYQEWRENYPVRFTMRFLAIAGEKDTMRERGWVITMLMCLQSVECGMERVQAMDCEIDDEPWLKIGAKVAMFSLI
ncbi:hypothetical protein BDV29DRAFT_185260 [Aspergillus leporis]|uniref:Uncharacterized protein n=1 Tax=Aspergillus leporis TaxID=41062 RepID=A0A5N5WL25_9EURO|nr:hypothetical protein BDV29DRAFT_185260 [Aspergillus leporis]